MKIILIAVMAQNRVIGRDNTIPWHIPEELQFFKKTTMGFPCVMGRKTYESLKGPLPGRRNLVISRDPDYHAIGIETAISLDEALSLCQGSEKVFILGGTQIFELALPITDQVILSILDHPVEGDCLFPELPSGQFSLKKKEPYLDVSTPFIVHYYVRE